MAQDGVYVFQKGEDAAYTIGYISKRMFDVVRYIVCRE